MNRNPLDRSAAFTCLLELDPENFGKQDMNTSGQTISRLLEDFHQSGQSRMYDYAQQWLAEPAAEAGSPAVEADGSYTNPETRYGLFILGDGQITEPEAG